MTPFLIHLQQRHDAVLNVWTEQLRSAIQRRDLMSERDLETQAKDVLNALLGVSAETTLQILVHLRGGH